MVRSGETREYIHRKNPSMWKIIHIHANSRKYFPYSRVSPLILKHPGMESGGNGGTWKVCIMHLEKYNS